MNRPAMLMIVLLVFIAASCSTGGSSTPELKTQVETPDPALAEVEAAACPQGVDPDVFAELKAELVRVLAERGSMKLADTAPTDERSAVQLEWSETESMLSWGYCSTGDGDQNSEVNVSDLTPLGAHFMATGPFDPDSVEAVIDGDDNGELNIADVTPIGANFGNQVVQYNVYTSTNADDLEELIGPAAVTEPVAVVPFVNAVGDKGTERLRFNLVITPESSGNFYWVRPSDGEMEGTPSNVNGPNLPPAAALEITPWEGLPLGADFDFATSSDPDGALAYYELDLTDDGTFDYAGAAPQYSTELPEPGTFTARLKVTDADGATASTTAEYNIVDVGGGTGVVDPLGGSLVFDDLEIQVPPGGIVGDIEITAWRTNVPPDPPEGFIPAPTAYHISTSDDSLLNTALKMKLPYDDSGFGDEEFVCAWVYGEGFGYKPLTILALDREHNWILVDSRMFGVFVVGWVDIGLFPGEFSDPSGFTIPFTAPVNGWEISNFGSYYSKGGNCLGLAGYANWFYNNRKTDQLYGRYPTDGGKPISITHLCGTRAHLAQSQYWAIKDFVDQQSWGHEWLSGMMSLYVFMSKEPLILVIGKDGDPYHACNLYGWDDTGFLFYDNNAPGQEKHLDYDQATGFGTYGAANTFGFVAQPSLGRAEDFAQLHSEADSGFTSSQDINLISPFQGEEITGYLMMLEGTLSGGLNDLAEVVAYVNGTLYTVPVSNGVFSRLLPVSKGDNTIIVIAGSMDQTDWKRNGACVIREVTGLGYTYELQVIANWKVNLADLDLYVQEPVGVPVWPGDPRSDSGTWLALDEDMGYGPEAVKLSSENDGVIQTGNYIVRLHYREDLGDLELTGPVSGNVTIVLNDGSEDLVFKTIPFMLESANPDNTAFEGTGPDWADIAVVDVANGVIN